MATTFDAKTNFGYGAVATAPSPAGSGTTLVLEAGQGALFPDPAADGDFNITVFPDGEQPISTNAEICRVTARSTDTLTIEREQEGTGARVILVGDQVSLTVTKKTLTDIEGAIGTIEGNVDQDVTSGSSPTFDGTNFSGIPSSALAAGVGIANDNLVEVDAADVADNDYAKFTANGLEGRSYAEVRSDLNVEDGADVTDATNVAAAGAVMATLFNAHTILYATTDDTPAALSVTEQTLVGRLTGGNISAVAIGIADNNIVQMDDADAADNDFAKFTANGLEGRSYSEVRSDLNVEDGADVTDSTNVNAAGAVMESDYNANTVLAATADNTPAALEVTEQTLVGRLTSGNIAAIAIGISDNNIVQMDDADAADNDYAKFTANGLEGRSYSEVATDISSSIDHDNLTGLDKAGSGVSYGHIDASAQTLYGVKTFDSFPVTPSSAPTTDYQVANKKYVDDVVVEDVLIDTTPDSDHTAHGVKGYFVANENQAFGDVCYVNADGEMQLGDADAIATASCVGMCVDATITAAATGTYLLFGVARDDTWAWTVGGLIYLSTTGTSGNTLTQTAPSGTDDVIQVIGVATHADRMLFNPHLVQVEHA